MKIAEVSEKYGIPQDTLRYYEREGAIPGIKRRNGNIRDYTDEDCKAIEFAQCLKAAGFTVEDIAEYRRISDIGDSTIPYRLAFMQRKREDILEQRAVLDKALRLLDHKIFCYERAVETGMLIGMATPSTEGLPIRQGPFSTSSSLSSSLALSGARVREPLTVPIIFWRMPARAAKRTIVTESRGHIPCQGGKS